MSRSYKNCKKLEKSQILLTLENSSVRGGRRGPNKIYDFCNFSDFSKNCEKLEKSQNLLVLVNSSVRDGRRGCNKICDFSRFDAIRDHLSVIFCVKVSPQKNYLRYTDKHQMRATEKRCIGQEFTIKYLTNIVGQNKKRKEDAYWKEKGALVWSEIILTLTTLGKELRKEKYAKKQEQSELGDFSVMGGGIGGPGPNLPPPVPCTPGSHPFFLRFLFL